MSSILITGASKGIGRAAAAELARRGHRPADALGGAGDQDRGHGSLLLAR